MGGRGWPVPLHVIPGPSDWQGLNIENMSQEKAVTPVLPTLGRSLGDLSCDNPLNCHLRLLTQAIRPFLKMYKNNCYEYFATIGKSKLNESQLKHPVATTNNNTCDLGLYWGDPEKLKHF